MLFSAANKMSRHHKSKSCASSRKSHNNKRHKHCDQLDDGHYRSTEKANKKRSTSIQNRHNGSLTKPISSNPSHEQLKQQSHSKYDYEGQTPKGPKTNHHSKSKSTPNPLRATSHSISKDDEKDIISLPLSLTSPTAHSTFDVKHETERNHSILTLMAMSDNVAKQNRIDALINFVTTTTTPQRVEIIKYLKTKYGGFDLEEYIEKNYKGIFKRILLYSIQSPLERNVYSMSIGCKKMKDINSIICILCQYKNGGIIKKMMNMYKPTMFEKSLEQQIIRLTSDNSILRSFVIGLLNGNRSLTLSHDANTATIDNMINEDILFLARILNQTQWDSMDAAKFVDIFTRRSFQYIRKLSMAFQKLAEVSLLDAFKGSIGDKDDIGYAVNCILLFATNEQEFYRKLLKKGMYYGGHKNILFWRIIIDRMDDDLMEILNGYGRYEGGKSDVDKYNLTHFVKVTLCKEDENAAKLLMKICNF